MSGHGRRWPRLTPLELRLKRVHDTSNARFENLERFYDRRPITERYVNGDAHLHLQLSCQRRVESVSGRVETESMWLLLWRAAQRSADGRHGWPVVGGDAIQVSVFIGVGEFADLAEPSPSEFIR